MDQGLYAAIITGVVALLVAALSAGLGAMWGRRHEQLRWFRDQKLAVYTEYLTAASAEPNDEEAADKRVVSLAKLSLSAPEEITFLAGEVDLLLYEEVKAVEHFGPAAKMAHERAVILRLAEERWEKFEALKYRMRLDLHRHSKRHRSELQKYVKGVESKYPKRHIMRKDATR
jgi:hypothetical protein